MKNLNNFINPSIFRQYDIRGKVGDDLNPGIVKKLGLAAGSYLRKKGLINLIVGRDNRLSSEDYSKSIIEGLLATGCNVVDLGLVSSPIFYFSLYHLNKDGGLMITGSHNPPEFNGFKVAEGKTTIYGEKIQELRKIIRRGDFFSGSGSLSSQKVIEDYMKTCGMQV